MAKVYGPATEQGMRRIVDVVRHVERSPGYSLNPGPRPRSTPSELWLPFENDTGETVPGNSLVRVTGHTVVEGVTILEIAKASTTFGREWAVTGNRDITSGEFGIASLAYFPVRLAYDTGTPANGETWGAKPSQFTASENYPGFRVIDIVDSTNKIMSVVREEPPFYLCKADSSITSGSTGTVSLYTMAEVDTTINVTAKALVSAISTSKWCHFVPFKASSYAGLVYQVECD